MNFDVKAPGNKSTRNRTLIKMLESPGLMISASGISNKISLPSDRNELCDRLKLSLKEKPAGNNSDKINEGLLQVLKNIDQCT